MRFLSLFAGIGGFDLGLERAGMECVGQVEIDPYCIKVLEKHWPDVPRWGDIRDVTEETLADAFSIRCGEDEIRRNTGTVDGTTKQAFKKGGEQTVALGCGGKDGKSTGTNQHPPPTVDLICGGFPCQPWSGAGKRRGVEDDRDLWPEMLRIIEAVRPNWVIGENVRGFVSMAMGLERSISDLEAIGYAVQAFIVPACAVDAPHRRDRCWIVANSGSNGRFRFGFKEHTGIEGASGGQPNGLRQGRRWQGTQNDPHADLFRSHREGLNQYGEAEPADGQEREPGSVREVLARRGDTEERETEDVGDTTSPRWNGGAEKRSQRIKKGVQVPSAGSEDVADTPSKGRGPTRGASQTVSKPGTEQRSAGCSGAVPNGQVQAPVRRDGQLRATEQIEGCGTDNRAGTQGNGWRWLPEPDVGRVAHGIPSRVDRLKCLGNAVVPQVVERIGYAILEAEGMK